MAPRTVRAQLYLLIGCLLPGCEAFTRLHQPDMVLPSLPDRITVPAQTARQLDDLVAGPAPEKSPSSKAPIIPTAPGGVDEVVPVFSLNDAITFALQNSPRLKTAAASADRAHSQEQVAFAPFLPEVDYLVRAIAVSANQSPGSPGPVGGVIPSLTGPPALSQAELDLQWTLWDFGRSSGRYGQAISRGRIAELRLVRARQTIAYDVSFAYLELLLAQASRRVREQAVRQARAILDDAQARREAGVADRDDVLRAQVQLSEADEALVVAQQADFNALARLNYTMGRQVTCPLRLVDWQARPAFDRSLAECLQTAAARRQEVAIARESVAVARQGLQVAQAEFLPHLYIRGNVGHVDGANVFTGWQEGAAIHLDGSLYTGGKRQGERDSAGADIQAALAEAEGILDTISLEVNLAFRGVVAARERIRLAESAVTQAEENLRLVRVKYKNGNATPTDIVDAETAATRSDQRRASAVYDYLAALARLEYALGTPQECLTTASDEEAALELPLPMPRLLPPGR